MVVMFDGSLVRTCGGGPPFDQRGSHWAAEWTWSGWILI